MVVATREVDAKAFWMPVESCSVVNLEWFRFFVDFAAGCILDGPGWGDMVGFVRK